MNIKQAALAAAIVVAGFFYEEIRSIPAINWVCTDWHWFWITTLIMAFLSYGTLVARAVNSWKETR